MIRWQHFPRSQRLLPHLEDVVKAFQAASPSFEGAYKAWEAWAQDPPPGSQPPRLESNQVLATVEPGLAAAGYAVEGPHTKLPVVVLWGENGKPRKSYRADAKIEHEPGRETVVEVEAGGAVANNAWRKDLMEASLMPYVDYLVIAVRSTYNHLDRKKSPPVVKPTPQFDIVTQEMDALYVSHRLVLPLKGVTVIGY